MPNLKKRVKAIHFVGIGGVGMSGIAEVLLNQGYLVSGSDANASGTMTRLSSLGITTYQGHHASQIEQADVIVVSSAISESNPEVRAANERNIPVISRAEMLAELMRFKEGIAVAGTHGKTTTTSLIATLLAQGNLDPTFVIGGKLNSAGTNAQLGSGDYFVAEADESDASFLLLKPMMAVVTNIDRDHMTTYSDDFNELRQTFIDFLHHLPFYGSAIMCIDNPVVKAILSEIQRPIYSYGFDESADYQAFDYRISGLKSEFKIKIPGDSAPIPISLNLPGKHNVQNALAAVAVANQLGVDKAAIQNGLESFLGIGRRFNVYENQIICGQPVTVVDDYGHHPSELTATLNTIRDVWPDRRLVMVFQPHRYSRTHDLFDDFALVLTMPNQLLLMEVYSAGEAPIAGADGRALCHAIRKRGKVDPIFVPDKEAIFDVLAPIVQPNDVVLFQGAGDIFKIAETFLSSNKICTQAATRVIE